MRHRTRLLQIQLHHFIKICNRFRARTSKAGNIDIEALRNKEFSFFPDDVIERWTRHHNDDTIAYNQRDFYKKSIRKLALPTAGVIFGRRKSPDECARGAVSHSS